MADVIELGQYRVRHKKQAVSEETCLHESLTVDEDLGIIVCDCGKHIEPFTALTTLLKSYTEAWELLDARQATLDVEADRLGRLQSAHQISEAMFCDETVPTCPHCIEPILAGDGLGTKTVSRELAERRRRRRDVALKPRTAESDR